MIVSGRNRLRGIVDEVRRDGLIAQVRLRIAARDVMLALEPLARISATNMIPGHVAEIHSGPGPFCDIRLVCGGTIVLARITRRSAERLGLRPGREVIAVIKAVSVNRRAGAAPEPAR